MHFLIETVTLPSGDGADREVCRWALAATAAEARSMAAGACADAVRAHAELEALGAGLEGELAWERGRVSFAPAG